MQNSKQHSKTYAGIGSRETPVEVQQKMTEIAKRLSRSSYCLRSGGATGADTAFEAGANLKQIFLPWNGFNGRVVDGNDYIIPEFCEDYVIKHHPKPSALSERGWLLMSRNAYQILGPSLNEPVEFVLCWTKDGKASGGTGQAIRIANNLNIPVFNLKHGFESLSSYMTFTLLSQ